MPSFPREKGLNLCRAASQQVVTSEMSLSALVGSLASGSGRSRVESNR